MQSACFLVTLTGSLTLTPLPVQRLRMLGANVRKSKAYSCYTCKAQGGTPSPQSLLGYGHGPSAEACLVW